MTWLWASTGVGSAFAQATLPSTMNEPSVGTLSVIARADGRLVGDRPHVAVDPAAPAAAQPAGTAATGQLGRDGELELGLARRPGAREFVTVAVIVEVLPIVTGVIGRHLELEVGARLDRRHRQRRRSGGGSVFTSLWLALTWTSTSPTSSWS